MHQRCRILGVPIDAVTMSGALADVSRWLDQPPAGRLITTPNSEMCVDAGRDRTFMAALSSADLAIPDSFGPILASRLGNCRLPERVSGADMIVEICRLAAEKGRAVALVGDDFGSAERAAAALRRRFASLRIVWAGSGGRLTRRNDGIWRTAAGVTDSIRQSSPDVIFAAFGHGKQEIWLRDILPSLPSVRLAMGVGGSLDFISGKFRRAPIFVRRARMEWLWRFACEPSRYRRIAKATVIFPWLVIFRRNW